MGNLSFYTTEEQIFDLFSKAGEIKRIIMGLDRVKKTPCGFCFVEYYRRCDTENSVNFLSNTKLDERTIRVDYDVGFSDGRQYGRGRSGGQVRDEHRIDYDPGRGGFGKAGVPQTGMTGMQMWSVGTQQIPFMAASNFRGRGRPYGDRGRRRGRARGRGRGRGRPSGGPPSQAPPRYFGGMGQAPMKRRREDEHPPPHADEYRQRYKRFRSDEGDLGAHAMGGPMPNHVNPNFPGPPPGVPMNIDMGVDRQREEEPVRNERFDRGRKEH